MKLQYSLDIDPVQLSILTVLNRSVEPYRYSELNIENIDNDLFNYHLQFLVKKDLVEKLEDGYTISAKGKSLMADIDAVGKKYELFRYSITANVIKEENGKKYILGQKRLRHPYYGDISTISGKIKKGELVADAAKRKLKEETGLDADFKVLGLLRKIRLNEEGNVVEDTVYNVCYAENPTGKLIEKNEYGENKWYEVEEFKKLHSKNIDIGKYDKEVFERIFNENFEVFHFEQISTIKDY
jgi:ADP-ribose pyrophosphatase YjhB (NUDIX family)